MVTHTLRLALRPLLGATLLLALAPAASGQVVINEIHYDPADGAAGDANNDGTRSSDDDEFVEIVNMGDEAVDLSGWTLSDAISVRHTFPDGTSLPAMSAIVVFGGGDPTGDFGGSEVQTTGSLGLNNGGDTVTLSDDDGDVVAEQTYDGSVDGESITRDPDGTGPFVAHSTATGSGGALFSPGTQNDGSNFGGGDGGTPGMIVVNTAEDEMNTDGDCSLREAVEAANTNAAVDGCSAGDEDGDTITFAGAYTIALTMGELLLTDDVQIDASDVGEVTVDAGGDSRIFDVDAASGAGDMRAVMFVSLALQNGDSGMGGSSAPDAGGAVDLKAGSEAMFTDVDVMDSVAGVNGGGIHGAGNTTIMITTSSGGSSTISGNVAEGGEAGMGGGGVWGAGVTMISGNVTIEDNAATGAAGSGGGVFNSGGTLEITGATIQNNTANRAGGGVEDFGDDDDDTDVTLTDVTLAGNSIMTPAPGNGGGLHSGGGDVVVMGGQVTGNSAVEGGGLWASGTMTVSGGTLIDGNAATSDDDEEFEGGGGVYNQAGTVTLDGVTISNNTATGPAGSGGGVFNSGDGTLTISNSSIDMNESARAGGGVEVNGGTVTLTDVDFSENTTGSTPGNGGALHVTAGDVTATDGEVTDNTAAAEGGGFWNNAGFTMTVDGTTFSGNEAQGPMADNGGGALYNNGGDLVVTDATIDGNSATGASGSGGGVLNNGGTLQIAESTVSNNTANRAGAGIEDAGGLVILESVTVSDNAIDVAAPGNGGGLHSGGGDVIVAGGSFTGNSAVEGGGLWSNGTLALVPLDEEGDGATVVSGNTATGDMATNGGGGIYAESGADVTVAFAQITDNAATGAAGSGGGVFVADGATVAVVLGEVSLNQANRAGAGFEVADDPMTDDETVLQLGGVTVRSNEIATAAPGNGGGLHIGGAGSAEVDGSTFAGNTAAEGAGLWVSASGSLSLSLSTVSDNSATGEGGGVYDDGGASISLMSVTVADNTAGADGGGLRSQGDSFSFMNTIVGNNTAGGSGDDCFGTFQSEDFNLIEDTDGCTIAGDTDNNVTGQDPMLEPLADNGGPTLTRALMAGSPAIDAGMTEFDVDQRGFARTDGQDDIGAFERGADDAGDLIACTAEAPLFFSDFDTDGDDPTFGEFAAIMNDSEDGLRVNLTTCSFVVFSAQTEQVTYSTMIDGTVEPSDAFVLATMGGDQMIPAMTLPDGPGAFALIEGTADEGDTVGEVAGRVVAAVVYRTEDDVFGSVRGGDGEDNAEALRAAFEALARAVPNEDDGDIDLTLVAAPNPAVGRAEVSFGVAAAADVRVAVYDALGREVAVLAEGSYGVGRYDVAFEAGSLPSGVYVVRAVVGSEAQTTRVTVVR